MRICLTIAIPVATPINDVVTALGCCGFGTVSSRVVGCKFLVNGNRLYHASGILTRPIVNAASVGR